MNYAAPVRDLNFAATELADFGGVCQLPGFDEVNAELLQAILEEADKFATEVLAPLNQRGDSAGVRLVDGKAVTADGWKDAYAQFIAGGWNGLPFSPEFGGQGLPWLVSAAVSEIWHAANMAFSLCPLLTQGAIEAITAHASDDQKATYLPKLVSGEWTGTMNLTEPQAGSDLSAVRTRATPDGDAYRLVGQKIFITYGDHDLSENIVHLVLARTPDAPPGVKGISLFIVPKFLPDSEGNWCIANDIETISLERKLGIHASPTAVLGYGSKDGAVGYLVGEENQGLVYMFTMMNVARHAVALEANGVAERAYQQAAAFAKQRVQGRAVESPVGERVAIIQHPDVQRMLWLQKSRTEALRGLALVVAAYMDHSTKQADPNLRANATSMVEILTPVVKGYATEMGVENVSLALQVHGGMGFIEETGAAQHYRDMRITPIYEGTTGIQALDLIGRKLVRDNGEMCAQVVTQLRRDCGECAGVGEVQNLAKTLDDGINALEAAANWILTAYKKDPRMAAAVSEPYLRLWGVVACGWQMACAARASSLALAQADDGFYRHKLRSAEFYFASEMPKVAYLSHLIRHSGELVANVDGEMFGVE